MRIIARQGNKVNGHEGLWERWHLIGCVRTEALIVSDLNWYRLRLNTLGGASYTFEHSGNITFTQRGLMMTEISEWKLRDSCSPEDETLWFFLQLHHEVEMCTLEEHVSWSLQAYSECQLIVQLCVLQPDCFSIIALMPRLFCRSGANVSRGKAPEIPWCRTVRARHQTADAVSD